MKRLATLVSSSAVLFAVGVPHLAALDTPAPPRAAAAAHHWPSAPPRSRALLRQPEIAVAAALPDGQYIAFLKPWKDTRNVWVKKTSRALSAARLVTAEPKRPIPGFFWSRDSKLTSSSSRTTTATRTSTSTPSTPRRRAARRQDGAGRAQHHRRQGRAGVHLRAAQSRTPTLIYVGLNDRDAAWHDVYKVTISTGRARRSSARTPSASRAGTSTSPATSAWRSASRTTATPRSCSVEPAGFTQGVLVHRLRGLRHHALAQGRQARVHADEQGRHRPHAARALRSRDGQGGGRRVRSAGQPVDFGSAIFAEATDELVGTSYEDERTRLYFRDKACGSGLQAAAVRSCPASEIDLGVDHRRRPALVRHRGAATSTPAARYLFDRGTKQLTLQYKVRERDPARAHGRR